MDNKPGSDLARFRSLARNWEVLGDTDPMYGVLSDPSRHGGRWDAESFFASGHAHVQGLLRMLNDARVTIRTGTCLDFGCGLGRLTIPLSQLFERTVGVDVAAPMIDRARQLQPPGSRCEFIVNRDPDLRRFADGTFDVVHSSLVLQHIPPGIATKYIAEFFRVARPAGTIVFQMPAEVRTADQLAASQALPPSAYRAELEFVAPPATLGASELAEVRVRVTNRSDVTWRHDIPGGRHICLGNHWLRGDGSRAVDDDGRAMLPYPVAPGDSVEIAIRVQAPDVPGAYILEMDLVQEHVCWFSQHGSRTACTEVSVSGQRPDTTDRGIGTRMKSSVDPPVACAVTPTAMSGPARSSLLARLLRRVRGGTPTFEMHVVPRAEVERVIRESGGELVRAVDDNAAGPGWLSYTYICRRR